MRRFLVQVFGVTWGLACSPALPRQPAPPPSYSPPAPPPQSFAAAHARVLVVDARPESARPSPESAPDAEAVDYELAPAPLAPDELAKKLHVRLGHAIGTSGAAELVFTVSVTEARALDPGTVRATVDISAKLADQTLATTRSVSTLVGWAGGQTPQTQARIEGAVADAFERGILRESFVQATNAALAQSQPPAPPAKIPPAQQVWHIDSHQASAKAHVATAVFDAGETYSLGARYLYDHAGDGHWVGYGGEVRLISADFDRADALAAFAVARAGGSGGGPPFSVELGLGPGGREHVRAMGIAGLYLSMYYVDVGFTAQFALRPTDEHRQLTGAHFGVRVSVPVDVHDIQVRCRSPLPCEASLLPGWSASPDGK